MRYLAYYTSEQKPAANHADVLINLYSNEMVQITSTICPSVLKSAIVMEPLLAGPFLKIRI